MTLLAWPNALPRGDARPAPKIRRFALFFESLNWLPFSFWRPRERRSSSCCNRERPHYVAGKRARRRSSRTVQARNDQSARCLRELQEDLSFQKKKKHTEILIPSSLPPPPRPHRRRSPWRQFEHFRPRQRIFPFMATIFLGVSSLPHVATLRNWLGCVR